MAVKCSLYFMGKLARWPHVSCVPKKKEKAKGKRNSFEGFFWKVVRNFQNNMV
jgi:hypothetical protein